MSLLNNVKNFFVCAISHEHPTVPVECPCGHLFDHVNILLWLNRNQICPVSRQPLNSRDLVVSRTIMNFLREVGFTSDKVTSEVAVQTDPAPLVPYNSSESSDSSSDDELPLLSHAEIASLLPLPDDFFDFPGPTPPFVALADRELVSAHLSESQLAYLSTARLVDLGQEYFNPVSSNFELLSSYIIPLNQAFINRIIPIHCTHPHIKINKYVYQHNSTDPLTVARALAQAGYFVYDLFLLNSFSNRLRRYVLYSCDTLANGRPNVLSMFVRYAQRI